jgi:hypothetical protein
MAARLAKLASSRAFLSMNRSGCSDRVAAQVVGQLGVEPTMIRDELKRLPGANA